MATRNNPQRQHRDTPVIGADMDMTSVNPSGDMSYRPTGKTNYVNTVKLCFIIFLNGI